MIRLIRTMWAGLGLLAAMLSSGCGDSAAPLPISVSILPDVASLPAGGTQDFTATVDNDPAAKGVAWTVTGGGCSGALCGTIRPNSSASGATVTYTSPTTVPTPAVVTITATSLTDITKLVSATVTISAIAVSVSPAAANVAVSDTQSFTATVQNDAANQGVTWMVTGSGCSGVACGTIIPTSSASGAPVTYTAPGTIPSPAQVSLTASSGADATKSASIVITIVPPPIGVRVSPASANVAPNDQETFVATVENDPTNQGVIWTVAGSGCAGAACGTITPTSSSSGAAATYTAPATVPNPADVMITATSAADHTKSASAVITVSSLISLRVTPTLAGVDVNTTHRFTATVVGDASHSGVTWTVTGSGCSGAACGTVAPSTSASGAPMTYTAPASAPNPALVTLTATAIADYTKAAPADVVITAPGVITVAVIPTGASIITSGGSLTRSFTAYVFNDPTNSGVTWSVGTGSISPTSSASGVPVTYTAPSRSSGNTIVKATSAADPTRFGTAVVSFLNSCPLVYSWDGKNWRLDSGTFGGAIVRALARTDVDNLDFVRPQDGVLRLKLADELDETEYVDQVAVWAVDHDSTVTVAPDGAGTIHSVGPLTLPAWARDFHENDVLARVSAADGWNWESTPTGRDTVLAADLRDGIELSFPKPSGASAARLVLDGNNTPWAAQMMHAFVSAHGRATQAWYDSLDAAPERARRMFATLAREAFLKVSVWKGGHWERQGLVSEAPPELVKRQVLPLDLRRVFGNTVRIRLESVPSFWALDQVALDFSPERALTASELTATSAVDGRGLDVRDQLIGADGHFFTMEQGDFAELGFQVPEIPQGQSRTYLLGSTGWYRIHTPEVAEPDVTLLNRLLTERHAISRIAVARMNEALRAMRASAR
jgi:hypothetical protein